MSARRVILGIAAALAIAALPVTNASAQNTGVGGDHNTRLMWRGTDYSISLWKMDPSFSVTATHAYGPYSGWIPVAMTTDAFNFTYVMWRNTDGSVSLWLVDPNLNFVNNKIYGPYVGWTAKGLSVDTSGSSPNFRLIWRNTNGQAAVWQLDGALNFVNSGGFGPFFGWDPGYTTE